MRVMLPLEHSGHTLMFYYTKGLAGYSPSKLRSTQTNVAQSHRAWERQLKDKQERAAAQAFFPRQSIYRCKLRTSDTRGRRPKPPAMQGTAV